MPKLVDHETRREDIAKAAFRAIQRKGVSRVTVADIARETGSSVGAVVHYIPSKDHIFLQAAEYSTLLIRGRMESAERDFVGLEAFRQVIYEGLPASADMVGHWKIWFGFWELSEHSELIRAAIHDRYQESHKRYGRLIRAAQKRGEISPRINIADAVTSLICQMDGIGVHTLISGRRLSAKKLREQADLWIERILVPRPQKNGSNVVPLADRKRSTA